MEKDNTKEEIKEWLKKKKNVSSLDMQISILFKMKAVRYKLGLFVFSMKSSKGIRY